MADNEAVQDVIHRQPEPSGGPNDPVRDLTIAQAGQPSVARLPPTIKVEEAGRILGISRTAAYRAAASGDLPTIRLNGRLYVPTPRLLSLLGYVVKSPSTFAG